MTYPGSNLPGPNVGLLGSTSIDDFLRDIGAIASGDAYINSSQYLTLRAALADARPGQTVLIPPGDFTSAVGVSAGNVVVADNVTVVMSRGTTIKVPTWGQPGIDAIGVSGLTTYGGTVQYVGTRVTGGGGSYRGGDILTNTAGVYVNKDRCTINGLRTIDMPVHTYFSSWNGISAIDRKGTRNNLLNWEASGYDFGVLWTGQDYLVIDNGYTHDDIDDSGGVNPTHGIYCSATPTFRSSNLVVSRMRSENNLYGHAYQFKHIDRFNITNMLAKKCAGIFSTIALNDGDIVGFSIMDSLPQAGAPNGSFTMQTDTVTTKNVRVSNGEIIMDTVSGTNQRAFRMGAYNSYVSDIAIIANRGTAGGDQGEMLITGDGNTLESMFIQNNGGVAVPAYMVGDTATSTLRTSIINPRVGGGCSNIATFYSLSSGVVEYTPEFQTLTTGTYVNGAAVYRTVVK